MANLLKVVMVETIVSLHNRGWSQRRIARELGINRETVARHLRLAAPDSNPAKAPIGSEPSDGDPKPANAPIGSVERVVDPKPAKAPPARRRLRPVSPSRPTPRPAGSATVLRGGR
jgi:hypothetical protein